MDLVDEDDRARAVLPGALRVRHDLLDFLDAGEHGGELNELGLGHVGDDLRQRSLAGAGRSPENEGSDVVALNLRPQRLARTDQVLLADKFIQRARTHAVGEWASAVAGVITARDGWEKTHAKSLHHRGDVQRERGQTTRSEDAMHNGLIDRHISPLARSGFPSSIFVSLCLCGDKPHFLCLATSYNTILAATPAFSDSTCAACGMATTSSISLMRSRGNPAPSLPIKIASGPASFA